MATGLKRDHIVILRIDGEDLLEFINGPSYESHMVSLFTQLDIPNGSTFDYVSKALQQLTVDHGMPPLSDPWVVSTIVEPALQWTPKDDGGHGVSQEMLLDEFKKVGERLAQLLKEQPVIVAHTEQIFDGSGLRRLFTSKFELNKTLERSMEDLPRDQNGKVSKEHLRVALDLVCPSAGLPSSGVAEEIDNIMNEAIHMKSTVEIEDRKMIEKEEMKKLMADILESVMLQLEGNPISVSCSSVVHESLSSSSSSTPSL